MVAVVACSAFWSPAARVLPSHPMPATLRSELHLEIMQVLPSLTCSAVRRTPMAAASPAPHPAAAALPAIALGLRLADAAACEAAALQLRDMVTNANGDAQTAVCVALARSSDVVDAAFVLALGRSGLSDAAQHALVTAMMTMLLHDDVKEVSTAMMLACPVYLPILLRIIAQEQPPAACRYINITVYPSPRHLLICCVIFTRLSGIIFIPVLKLSDQSDASFMERTARPASASCLRACPARSFASSTRTPKRTTEPAP